VYILSLPCMTSSIREKVLTVVHTVQPSSTQVSPVSCYYVIICSVKFCFLPYEHLIVCVVFEVPTALVMNISMGYNTV
jgi:hypothetical protein